MIFDERNRLAKVFVSAKQLKNKTVEEKLAALMDLNNFVLRFSAGAIKAEKPGIKGKKLLEELRKRFDAASAARLG